MKLARCQVMVRKVMVRKVMVRKVMVRKVMARTVFFPRRRGRRRVSKAARNFFGK
jgi:hypothetical protein